MLQAFEKIIIIIIWLSFSSSPSWGKDGCLLVVDIVRQEIVSPSEFQVELVSTSGNRVQAMVLKGSRLEICDYDFGEYHLKIRAVGCFETTLFGIGKHYPDFETYRVPVPTCGHSQAYGVGGTAAACLVNIRIRDSQSKPVPHAVVRVGDGRDKTADEYGRLAIMLPISGEMLAVEITAKGYRREVERMRCESRRLSDTSNRYVWLSEE